MKSIDFYRTNLQKNSDDEVFNYLLDTLKPSLLIWSYFVNWDKVFENTKEIELSLNILNYLIGKQDFDNEFRFVIKKNPQVLPAIPALLVRDGSNNMQFKMLVDYKNKKLVYDEYDFTKSNPTDNDIEKYLVFVTKSGLKELFEKKKIKNLVDYMVGVEAGLDSNARKNRSGTIMQEVVEFFIKDVCSKKGYRYLPEADSNKIKTEFGYTVPVDKSSRRYDFAIDNGKELFIVETNYYSGGGSKLKSTAGEYRNLYDVLNGKYKFFWITDGLGWKVTSNPLRETFNHNDYVFNLNMLENGLLESLLT